jgi:hypothetical protein
MDAVGSGFGYWESTIFDNKIVNQDIFITHRDTGLESGVACNYYIELKQMALNDNQATMATLQSLRQIAQK